MGNDAVNKVPSLDEQMGAFKGFSTEDGEVAGSTAVKGDAAAQEQARQPAKAQTAAEKLAALGKPAGKATKQAQAEDEHADEDENAEADEGAGEGEDEGADEREQERSERRPKSADKRIAQAVGRQRAAERRAEAAERSLADLNARMARLEQGGLTQGRQPANNAADDQNTPPDPSDYQYGELDVKFIADTARYETLKTLREQDARRAQAQRQTQEDAGREAMAEKFRDFEVAGLARYDDFDEVVTESAKRGEWALSPLLASLLIDSDHGTDIAYHLASNRDEAKRVYAMTPAQQAKWFGQREAVLSSETPDARQIAARVSQAPGVPRREARGSGSRQQVSPDTADFAAFERLANSK